MKHEINTDAAAAGAAASAAASRETIESITPMCKIKVIKQESKLRSKIKN